MFITDMKCTFKEEVIGFKCDKCEKEYQEDDIIEFQEFHVISVFGGYGSVFGDGSQLQGTFCQSCVKDMCGSYLKNIEED